MSLITKKTQKFLQTLSTQLNSTASVTPEIAKHLHRASMRLEGARGITQDHIEKVGRDLKLTGPQKAMLKLTFLLDVLSRVLPANWQQDVKSSGDALRKVIALASSSEEVASKIDAFQTAFTSKSLYVALHPLGKKPQGAAVDGGKVWLLGPQPKSDISWKDVQFFTADKRIRLAFNSDGIFEVSRKRGGGYASPLWDQTDAAALESALRELPPKTAHQRKFRMKAIEALHKVATYNFSGFSPMPPLQKHTWQSPGPGEKKITPHENDLGAFSKGKSGWSWAPAQNGVLGESIEIAQLGADALLEIKKLLEARFTSAKAIRQHGSPADIIDELDRALGRAAVESREASQKNFEKQEMRLRNALQDMPPANLARDVFHALVGATTPLAKEKN